MEDIGKPNSRLRRSSAGARSPSSARQPYGYFVLFSQVMSERNVVDADFRVVEPRHEWRIRFWPTVFFWIYFTGCAGAAVQEFPRMDKADFVIYLLMAACISPFVRFAGSAIAALTDGQRVSEDAAEELRQRMIGREL